jgi:hypothetical protein
MIVTDDWSVVMKELGYKSKQKPAKPQKEVKCRVCGAPMVGHVGTNVFTCTGMVEKKDGEESKLVPCDNIFLRVHLVK